MLPFNLEAQTDEIKPSSTCGERINIKGSINKSSSQQRVSVDNATDSNMYLDEVYGKDFKAKVENLPEGLYTLEIYMAEQYHNKAGARKFNIYYDDTLIKENLDIFSEVGANSEYKFSYPMTYLPQESNNELSISFKTVVDNSKFNAIRILG